MSNRIECRYQLDSANTKYLDLVDGRRWGPSKGEAGPSEIVTEIYALKTGLANVKRQLRQTDVGGSGGKEDRECCNCHKKGCVAQKCPDNKPAAKDKKVRWVTKPPEQGSHRRLLNIENSFTGALIVSV